MRRQLARSSVPQRQHRGYRQRRTRFEHGPPSVARRQPRRTTRVHPVPTGAGCHPLLRSATVHPQRSGTAAHRSRTGPSRPTGTLAKAVSALSTPDGTCLHLVHRAEIELAVGTVHEACRSKREPKFDGWYLSKRRHGAAATMTAIPPLPMGSTISYCAMRVPGSRDMSEAILRRRRIESKRDRSQMQILVLDRFRETN